MSGFELVASALGVRIEGEPIVEDVDLHIAAGTRLAIVGRSGSGKSTLARALIGLEPQLHGSLRVRIAGQSVELVGASRGAWRRLRGRIQLCWQDGRAALDPRARVSKSLAEARALAGMPTLDAAATRALLARVSLDPAILGRRPAQLSGGQCQRVALARALSTEPALLIADEVTSNLDRPLALQIVDLLASAAEVGTALVVITHDLSLLEGLVDEVVVLDAGRVVERGAWREIRDSPTHATTRALIAAL